MLLQLNQFEYAYDVFHRNDPADVKTVVCIKQERIMQQLQQQLQQQQQ
jgi:hypothetical protein